MLWVENLLLAPAAVPVIAAKPAYPVATYSAPQPVRQTTTLKPQQTTSHTYTSYTSNPSTTANATTNSATKLNSKWPALSLAVCASNFLFKFQLFLCGIQPLGKWLKF